MILMFAAADELAYCHKADVAKRPSEVRFRRDNGQQMLKPGLSAFDPKRTFALISSRPQNRKA